MKPDPDLLEEIIGLARQVALRRGWPWLEPVDVISISADGEAAWLVRTNALNRGQNVRIALRRSDLTLISIGFLPR